jgi:23S rRNA pseudouridine1911/1915/1917 synthase
MSIDTSSFKIEIDDENVRVDLFLSKHFPDISRSKIQSAIKNGAIHVNGKSAKKSTHLKENDNLEIVDSAALEAPNSTIEITPEEMDLDIIFEDDNFLILNKKAGVVVHPGNGNPDGTLLNGVYGYLKGKTPKLIHRLDKDTTGVIMVAKDDKSHDAMSKLFVDREVYKGYIGVTIGRTPADTGVVTEPLGRSKTEPIKRAIRQDGRDSRTDFALIKNYCGMSIVAYRLHTGRTHQIRVHSTFAGFPIIMDNFYGGLKEKVKRLEPLDRAFAYRVYKPFSRQALHARFISFIHPFTNENIEIYAPFPEDFRDALETFEVTEDQCAVFKTDLMDNIQLPLEDNESAEYLYV